MPDLLFLMQRLPYPPIKGEKIRNWHILNYLAKWYDVHFGCLIDDPADMQHIETVRALCASLYTAPLDRRLAKLTCARGLLTGEPLSVTYFRDRGLRHWVADVMAPRQTGNDIREFLQYGAVHPRSAAHRQTHR